MATHDIVTVRGKRGSPVPVLIPKDTKPLMDYISDRTLRESLNLNLSADDEGIEYIFANTGTNHPCIFNVGNDCANFISSAKGVSAANGRHRLTHFNSWHPHSLIVGHFPA